MLIFLGFAPTLLYHSLYSLLWSQSVNLQSAASFRRKMWNAEEKIESDPSLLIFAGALCAGFIGVSICLRFTTYVRSIQ